MAANTKVRVCTCGLQEGPVAWELGVRGCPDCRAVWPENLRTPPLRTEVEIYVVPKSLRLRRWRDVESEETGGNGLQEAFYAGARAFMSSDPIVHPFLELALPSTYSKWASNVESGETGGAGLQEAFYAGARAFMSSDPIVLPFLELALPSTYSKWASKHQNNELYTKDDPGAWAALNRWHRMSS